MSEKFTIRRSKKTNKKYDAVFDDGHVVSFGDRRYQHYEDRTKLRAFSHLDHLDPARRAAFDARHRKNIGRKYSAGWFSKQYLW